MICHLSITLFSRLPLIWKLFRSWSICRVPRQAVFKVRSGVECKQFWPSLGGPSWRCRLHWSDGFCEIQRINHIHHLYKLALAAVPHSFQHDDLKDMCAFVISEAGNQGRRARGPYSWVLWGCCCGQNPLPHRPELRFLVESLSLCDPKLCFHCYNSFFSSVVKSYSAILRWRPS